MAAAIQDRFDELAKGLATRRLSRGQVLQGFGAALGMNVQCRIAFAAKLCRTWVPRPGWNPMNTLMGTVVSLPSGCSPGCSKTWVPRPTSCQLAISTAFVTPRATLQAVTRKEARVHRSRQAALEAC